MVLAFVAVVASSQFITGPAVFSPANPTDAQQIRATYTAPGLCGTSPSTVVSGTDVRTTVSVGGCLIGPPPFQTPASAFFGPLPAGTYTYEIYEVYEGGLPRFVSTQPLVVIASVPTLHPIALVALVLAFGSIAFFVLRR